MKFNVYGSKLENGNLWPSLLIEEARATPQIIMGDELLKSYEVEHYVEAAILMHEDFGFEPYRPTECNIEEYLAALKRLGKSPKSINDKREKAGLDRLDYLEVE